MQNSILGACGRVGRVGGEVLGWGGAQVVLCILVERIDRLRLHYVSNERQIIGGGRGEGVASTAPLTEGKNLDFVEPVVTGVVRLQ